jgi:hypothetical protein
VLDQLVEIRDEALACFLVFRAYLGVRAENCVVLFINNAAVLRVVLLLGPHRHMPAKSRGAELGSGTGVPLPADREGLLRVGVVVEVSRAASLVIR